MFRSFLPFQGPFGRSAESILAVEFGLLIRARLQFNFVYFRWKIIEIVINYRPFFAGDARSRQLALSIASRARLDSIIFNYSLFEAGNVNTEYSDQPRHRCFFRSVFHLSLFAVSFEGSADRQTGSIRAKYFHFALSRRSFAWMQRAVRRSRQRRIPFRECRRARTRRRFQ